MINGIPALAPRPSVVVEAARPDPFTNNWTLAFDAVSKEEKGRLARGTRPPDRTVAPVNSDTGPRFTHSEPLLSNSGKAFIGVLIGRGTSSVLSPLSVSGNTTGGGRQLQPRRRTTTRDALFHGVTRRTRNRKCPCSTCHQPRQVPHVPPSSVELRLPLAPGNRRDAAYRPPGIFRAAGTS